MHVTKLQKLKDALRKYSVIIVSIGLLTTSYGTYLSSNSANVYADWFEPDCAPPNGTGATVDKVVSAGARRVGFIGTAYRVKNCSNTQKEIGAKSMWGTCNNRTESCPLTHITTITPVKLAAGEYTTFYAPDVNFSCGSGRTAVVPDGMQAEGFFTVADKDCGGVKPTQSASPTASPNTSQNMCQSLGISSNTVTRNNSVTLTARALHNQVKTFTYGLYNLDNLYSAGNPKPIHFTSGQHAVFTNYVAPTNINTKVINFNDVNKPDMNAGAGGVPPTHIQVNAFFTNSSNVFSQPDPKCVVNFTLVQATPTASPTVTPTPTRPSTPTPVPTSTPTVTPPIGGPATATPTASPPVTPAATPSNSPTPTPSALPETTQLKFCKYEDDNANGIIDSGENIISWTFNYEMNGQSSTVDSHWWHVWNQGCAIVDVPVDTNITVSEASKTGWRPTAIYSDGARVDGTTYNYTSDADSVKVMWFLNTFTADTTPAPSTSPTISPTVSPTSTASPSVSPTTSPTASITASPTVSPTVSPTATASSTATATTSPTASPTTSATASPKVSPTASPGTDTQLKICKYNDENNDGIVNNGEGTLGWNFTYTIDNTATTINRSAWDILVHQGCVITDVPSNKSITVREEGRTDWTQTAVYADGAKTDQSTYTYTSTPDDIKVIWFLNHNTPGTTPSPSPTGTVPPTESPTTSPTVSPTATPIVSSSNYNITLEKRVDGTRVDGDHVGIQYRIRIRNNGSSRVDRLEVRDTLPPDFTYDANTTEGDINRGPDIQDISGDDNRRLVWRDIALDGGKEINFGYRTTGKRTDTNFCNDAQVRRNDNIISTSQACTRINQAGQTAVLAATTTKTLPATGSSPWIYGGILLVLTAGLGWRLSRHAE